MVPRFDLPTRRVSVRQLDALPVREARIQPQVQPQTQHQPQQQRRDSRFVHQDELLRTVRELHAEAPSQARSHVALAREGGELCTASRSSRVLKRKRSSGKRSSGQSAHALGGVVEVLCQGIARRAIGGRIGALALKALVDLKTEISVISVKLRAIKLCQRIVAMWPREDPPGITSLAPPLTSACPSYGGSSRAPPQSRNCSRRPRRSLHMVRLLVQAQSYPRDVTRRGWIRFPAATRAAPIMLVASVTPGVLMALLMRRNGCSKVATHDDDTT